MKIGIVADTHSRPLPEKMLADFKSVDFIIHAGDFCLIEDLRGLETVNKVVGVFGNMDGSDVRRCFLERQIIVWQGKKIGVCHGHGSRDQVLGHVQKEFKRDQVDAVVFGHSHQPFNEVIDGVLYFNPGSPTDIVSSPYLSYGLLEVKNNKLVGKIVKV